MQKQITLYLLIITASLFFGCTPAPPLPVSPISPEAPVIETSETETSTLDVAPPEPQDTVVTYNQLKSVLAIANESGDQLITFTPLDNTLSSDSIDVAIGANGQYLPIVFNKEQQSDDQDTQRITAYNFTHMAGVVYDIPQKNAIPNETYFLSNRLILPEQNLLISSFSEPVELTADISTAISSAKQRAVQQAWTLANYGDEGNLHLAVFEPEGNNYLFSIILETSSGVYKFIDYPAESDNSSVWRVDDMGSVDPSLFKIRCAVMTDQGLVFIISWIGAEGENTFFLLEKPDNLEEQPNPAYRYWSPL